MVRVSFFLLQDHAQGQHFVLLELLDIIGVQHLAMLMSIFRMDFAFMVATSICFADIDTVVGVYALLWNKKRDVSSFDTSLFISSKSDFIVYISTIIPNIILIPACGKYPFSIYSLPPTRAL